MRRSIGMGFLIPLSIFFGCDESAPNSGAVEEPVLTSDESTHEPASAQDPVARSEPTQLDSTEVVRALIDADEFDRARELLVPIAAGGDAWAQYELGRLLGRAAGGSQDVTGCVELLTAAADQGHVEAQFELGWIHWASTVGPRDPVKAHDYMRMAHDAGYDNPNWITGVEGSEFTIGRALSEELVSLLSSDPGLFVEKLNEDLTSWVPLRNLSGPDSSRVFTISFQVASPSGGG